MREEETSRGIYPKSSFTGGLVATHYGLISTLVYKTTAEMKRRTATLARMALRATLTGPMPGRLTMEKDMLDRRQGSQSSLQRAEEKKGREKECSLHFRESIRRPSKERVKVK